MRSDGHVHHSASGTYGRNGGNKFCNKETERSQNNDHQSDPDILRKHEKQSSDDRNDSEKKLCESKQKTIRKNIGISNDAAYDITGAVAVQIGERKYLNMTDRFCTDILYRTEGHTVVNDIHDPVATLETMIITRIPGR